MGSVRIHARNTSGPTRKGQSIWLTDDAGAARAEFDVGESIYVAGNGLRPAATYMLSLLSDADREPRRESLAHLTTDRHGELPETCLLPFLGLISGPAREKTHMARSHDEAERVIGGRRFQIDATPAGDEKTRGAGLTAHFAVAERGKRPQVVPSDLHGLLLTGVLRGKEDVAVTFRNFPAGCVRIYLVHRQFHWQPGDRLATVKGRDGRPIAMTLVADDEGRGTARLWRREQLRRGSYQIVARAFRPGWYQADEDRLLATDVLSSRRITSFVVRATLAEIGMYENGVFLTPELAGRPLPHAPYFTFVNNFPKGTDVWAALDPGALPAGLNTQRAAIYVIRHKTAAEWAASTALVDVTGPGMTPAVKIVPIVPGCINWNRTLVWTNPQTLGQYDVVIDYGNNAADPSLFAPDASLDAPRDMIDGYVRVGFYVTDDPSLIGPYGGSVGQHEYNLGTIQVPSTDAGPTPTVSLPLRAVVRYPAQTPGIDTSFAAGSFPLAVVMHGNSGMETSYLGYNYLLEHLAGHGFIAASIYAPVGAGIETRARAILAHLGILSQKNSAAGLFQGHVDLARIGIVGHSRGGEAVVRASRINTIEALGWNLLAGIAIAPTDYFHYGDPGLPLLVIYGANDGDVSGQWPNRTGFNIYDEAGRPRSFIFVYGATHDRFNTEWASIEASTELTWDIASSDLPRLISPTAHESVAKGYVTAFLQGHVMGRTEQLEYTTGALRPSLVAGVEIHASHQSSGTAVLDDFEQLPHDAGSNTPGGAVTGTNLAGAPVEDALHTLDSYSPHVTAGGEVAWSTSQGAYGSLLPPGSRDLSGYTTLSFRVTQKYGSARNPTNTAQDFRVRLTDGQGRSRAIAVGTFTTIPYPYERGFVSRIKSALKSVRIPLASFVIANLGASVVDLGDVRSIAFEFATTPTGDLEIDDIEFGST
jgi:dienelactone hydrolase